MVVAEVANLSEVAVAYTSAPLFKAVVLLGVIALIAALRDPVARSRLNRWTVAGIVLIAIYVAGQLIALVGTVDVAASSDVMWRSAVDLAYLIIIMMLTQVTGRPWAVAAAVAGTLAVLSLLTIASYLTGGQQTFGGLALISTAKGQLITTQRYAGPYGDSNFWGRLLVLGLPMAWALARRGRAAGLRARPLGWLLAGGAMLIGAYLTQSRGTLLAAGVAVLVWFIASGRARRLALAPVALIAAFLIPGIGDRMVALFGDLFSGRRRYDIDPSILGREASQQVAWKMFEQRPSFGFGPGSFLHEVPYYTDRVTRAVDEGLVAPHNLYAQLLAESGITGLITWLIMVGGILTILILRIAADPKSVDRALAAATLTGVITWSIASVFLHLAYFRSFAIVLALACALGPKDPVPPAVIRNVARSAALWAVAVAVGAGVTGANLMTARTPAVQASQKVILWPVGPIDGWSSYAMNLRHRRVMLPTMVEVMYNTDSPAEIAADPIRGIATFSVTAATEADARRDLADAMAVSRTRVSDNVGPLQYRIRSVTSVRLEQVSVRSAYAPLYAAGWGLTAMLLTRILLGWLTARLAPRTPVPAAPQSVGAPT